MRIAFAGNPNSGKTTMYNVLTGENERVGNWGGVTVGKKEAPFDDEFSYGKGWLWSAIGLQMCTGYTLAFLINQIGTLIATGHVAAGFVPGAIAILVMLLIDIMISRKIRAHFVEKYTLHAGAATNAA